MDKAILLVNTGTPDSPDPGPVKKYLSEFLNDPDVIDIPWLARKALVNLIIVPFRTSRSVSLYRRLWTHEGSPLKINLGKLVSEIRKTIGPEVFVTGAMRYGNPSLRSELDSLREASVKELTILPLYPQYASSTTGSVKKLAKKLISSWEVKPRVKFVDQFYSHSAYIAAYSKLIRSYHPESFDHLLFTYHSLPESHINRIHPWLDYHQCNCARELPEHGEYCYRAACFATTRLLAGSLGIGKDQYSSAFQSRISGKWIGPFTDTVLKELAVGGRKKVLVIAPSFVADCLETLVEIGEEYTKLFHNHGGTDLVLVDSLNYNNDWAEAVIQIASEDPVT